MSTSQDCPPGLSITDEEGNVLRVERVRTSPLNKRFLVEYGSAKKLRFKVYGKSLGKASLRHCQLEEQMVVTVSV